MGRIATRLGGYSRAKKIWACKKCGYVEMSRRVKCAGCLEKKSFQYFASKAEYERWKELCLFKSMGLIQGEIAIHPKYSFGVLGDGEVVPDAIAYYPDFSYMKDGTLIVEDVKGYGAAGFDPIFKLKARLMKQAYGIDVLLVRKKKTGFEHLQWIGAKAHAKPKRERLPKLLTTRRIDHAQGYNLRRKRAVVEDEPTGTYGRRRLADLQSEKKGTPGGGESAPAGQDHMAGE